MSIKQLLLVDTAKETEKIVVSSMGSLISSSSSPTKTKDNMRQKRSVTSADYDYKVFGLSEDLENWMKNLPPKLKAIPIIYLAIPGEYDK